MTSDVITITPGTTLKDTSRFMIKNYRRRLPVMSEGDLVGIVSTFDIIEYFGSSLMLERMKTSTEDVLSIRIQELMNKNPITIAPDADIGQAVDLMKRSGIGFLPVVQDHDIRGVITERDILLKLIEEEYA
jgi:CBS domain-containing protein